MLFDGSMFQFYGEVLQHQIPPSIVDFDCNQFSHLKCIPFDHFHDCWCLLQCKFFKVEYYCLSPWGLKGQIFVTVNPTLIFLFMRDWFMAWFTHPARVILSGSMWLFLDIAAFLTFLNVVLNGLKQDTSNGCKTCDVWNGKIIMSNPKSCACSTLSRVIWLPCPSKTNKCWLVRDNPPGIDFLNKVKNYFNKKEII